MITDLGPSRGANLAVRPRQQPRQRLGPPAADSQVRRRRAAWISPRTGNAMVRRSSPHWTRAPSAARAGPGFSFLWLRQQRAHEERHEINRIGCQSSWWWQHCACSTDPCVRESPWSRLEPGSSSYQPLRWRGEWLRPEAAWFGLAIASGAETELDLGRLLIDC